MFVTFLLFVFGMIIFRVESISQIGEYIGSLCNQTLFTMPNVAGISALLMNIVILMIVEWLTRTRNHGLDLKAIHPVLRYAIYLGLLFMLFAFSGQTVNFIYFQF